MKKIAIIIFIWLYLLSTTINLTADNPSKKEMIDFAIKFLNNLKTGDKSKIKNMLSANVRLETLSYKKILELADDMMTEKITLPEYIFRITGHNLQQFLKGQIELIQFSKVQEYGMEKNIGYKKIKGDFYYIRFKISYKENKKNINDKSIEIDILKENNKLKIFGFII